MNDKCPICQNDATTSILGGDRHRIKCRRCGEYEISGSARVELFNKPLEGRVIANASGWIRENPSK